MKTNFYLTLLTLLIVPTLIAQPSLPKGVDNDWYTQSLATVKKMEYAITPAIEKTQFYGSNSAQQLHFSIHPQGYTVQHSTADWTASFRVKGLNNRDVLQHPFALVRKDDMLTYQYPSLGIQYINNEQGLRQNFIISTKPDGNEGLTVAIAVSTDLQVASIGNNAIALHTKGNKKAIKMVYDGLEVWDAAKKELTATMTVNKENNIIITVDDANAIYPITIDPINRTAEWSTSADGILPGLLNNLQLQVQTTYGYTVTGLGDINGDSFDDVAVSAPGMADVWSGNGSLTAVGAVFIYLGSPTGLKNTPDKILQPTTALNGAFFGLSVDAGDITGDGKNDIVISAPLDSYQTTASSLLGSTNVTVKAGKVYVYRSEDLFTAPNPSAFLEIKLEGPAHFKKGLTSLLGNTTLNALFGYSVAVTKDVNGDNKADILIGCPAYMGVDLLAVQNGTAFIYYSDNLATSTPQQLNPPDMSLLGISGLPLANTTGLLFGYSIDGAGDFNKDGHADIIVGAPAGIDLSSLGGLFTGQVLGGSAYIYYGNGTSISTTSQVKLQASGAGLLSNAANLFGYKVKGAENAFGVKTGNILIGAPAGNVVSNATDLKVKAGQLHLFKQKTNGATGTFVADQVLSSPRSSSILSILSGNTINMSLLYAASFDNMMDANCDNIGDIIVGEPLSTAVALVGSDIVGGAAYIYLGNADGTYQTVPYWDLYTHTSALLGLNTTSLLGFSVAGAGHIKGSGSGVRSLVGGPSNALDFGTGLLNLNNTISTLLDFTVDNNGLGKSYSFAASSNCNMTLPVSLINFEGEVINKTVPLKWVAITEIDFSHYQLERSVDGVHYQTIAMVLARNEQRNEYAFTDKHPVMGTNYYRLKMINNDESYTYSAVVVVKFTDKSTAHIVIAPNPVQQTINLTITGLQNGIYKMQISNTAGQIFITKSIAISSFTQIVMIDRKAAMASGIYSLALYDANGQKIKTLQLLLQ